MILNVHVSLKVHAAFCSWPTFGTPLAMVKPMAPAWYIGLFFIHTWLPVTMSDWLLDGFCLRHFVRYFSQRRLRCANGSTPLKLSSSLNCDCATFAARNHRQTQIRRVETYDESGNMANAPSGH